MLRDLNKRASAYLIDLSVGFTVTYLCMFAVMQAAKTYFHNLEPMQEAILLIQLQKNVGILFIFNFFSYLMLSNFWGNGRSLGCVLCDLAVVNENRTEITFEQAFKRTIVQCLYLAAIVSIVLIPLLIIPFFRKSKLSLSDSISKTHVIALEDSFDHHFETEFTDSEMYIMPLLEHLPVEDNVIPFPSQQEVGTTDDKQVA